MFRRCVTLKIALRIVSCNITFRASQNGGKKLTQPVSELFIWRNSEKNRVSITRKETLAPFLVARIIDATHFRYFPHFRSKTVTTDSTISLFLEPSSLIEKAGA